MYYMMGMVIFCPVWSIATPVSKAVDVTLYGYELYLSMFGLAIIYFIEQAAISKSMEYNTVGVVQVIMYLCIPFGFFLDWAILDQPMGGMALGGAGVICGLNILINSLRIKGYIE